MVHSHALMIHYEKYDQRLHIAYRNVIFVTNRNSFICNLTLYICKLNYVDVVGNIYFKEYFPDDDYNRCQNM
jgi:hypothetical protein